MPTARSAVCACAAALALAAPAAAESGVLLPYPPGFQTVPAATYTTEGERVGGAHLVIERLDSGNVRMISKTGFDRGARTVLSAELEPVDGGSSLRPVWQESRSFDPQGTPLGVLRVDHVAGIGRCIRQERGEGIEAALELPERDHVVNVPLNLLFLPLARGDRDEVDFQFFLCRGGARLMDFQARRARQVGPDGQRFVEITYGPDFGTFGSMLMRSMLPRLSMWVDPAARQPWLAHRVPLYSKGPEVLVVRDGIPPAWLEAEN